MTDLERTVLTRNIRMLADALRMARNRPMTVTEQQLIDSVLLVVDEVMARENANTP
jgi:hypothetical protein